MDVSDLQKISAQLQRQYRGSQHFSPPMKADPGKNSLEDQVREIAFVAACKRWNLHQWDTLLTIKRVEPDGPAAWIGYYDEPDTLTEESIHVEQIGKILQASYGVDVLVEWKIEGE